MFDMFSGLFSIAMYVLQAIGLYTIAQRRGIRHAWLAWVPVGSVWILGSIADDYRVRGGRKSGLRIWLVILAAAVLVLSLATLIGAVTTLTRVLTVNEILGVVMDASGMGNDLYAPTEDELVEELALLLEERLTDQVLEETLNDVLFMVLGSLAMGLVGIAAGIIEYICLYRVFESCDPANRTLYFLLSLFISLGPVFLFICRHKDDGLPKGIPASCEPLE